VYHSTGRPFSGKSGKPGKVKELRKTWKKPGKVRESLRVLSSQGIFIILMERNVAHERFTFPVPVYRRKLAAWKSGQVREKSGKIIVRKNWPPCSILPVFTVTFLHS